MSKRSHHRNKGININELAEALTQRGWQPPQREFPAANMMMPGGGPLPPGGGNGNNPMNNSLSALSGLLGAVNGGNIPPGNMMPMQGAMQGTMPMQNRMPHQQPSEQDLLKALFQQTIRTLKNE